MAGRWLRGTLSQSLSMTSLGACTCVQVGWLMGWRSRT